MLVIANLMILYHSIIWTSRNILIDSLNSIFNINYNKNEIYTLSKTYKLNLYLIFILMAGICLECYVLLNMIFEIENKWFVLSYVFLYSMWVFRMIINKDLNDYVKSTWFFIVSVLFYIGFMDGIMMNDVIEKIEKLDNFITSK